MLKHANLVDVESLFSAEPIKIKKKKTPDGNRARELLTYCPISGVLRWKINKSRLATKGSIAGCLHPDGYRMICIDGVHYPAHRVIIEMLGLKHFGLDVDHVNHERSDNRACNIRIAGKPINSKNKSMHSRNTSGIMGVSFQASFGRWIAKIGGEPKTYLGAFECFFDACAARKSAEIRHLYHKKHGA